MKWSLVVFFILSFIKLNAQSYSQLKRINGAISDVIYCVFQDSRGYIWVGTESGVSRYDGYSFKHFTRDDGLSDDDVFKICEDSKNRLWLLTYNGLPTIYDDGKILTSKNSSFLSTVRPGRMAVSFFSYGDTVIYTTRKIAYIFVQDSLIREVKSSELFTKEKSISFTQTITISQTPVLITTSGIFNIKTEEEIPLPKFCRLEFGNYLTSVYRNGILYYYNAKEPNLYKFNTINRVREKIDLRKNYVIKKLFYSRHDSTIGIVTEKAILKYNPQDNQVHEIISHTIPFAINVCIDRRKNMWISSLLKGVFFAQETNVKTLDYITDYGTATAYSLAVDDEKVYVGYINNEYGVWENGTIQYERQPGRKKLGKIYEFCPSHKDLYVASDNFFFNAAQPHLKNSRSWINIKALAISNNALYIAQSKSLKKINLDSLEILLAKGSLNTQSNLYSKRINTMAPVGHDSIYLGTIEGLRLLVGEQVQPLEYQPQSLLNTSVTDISIDTSKKIYFSTAGSGIGILVKDSCYRITKSDGLKSNVCNSLYRSDSILWVATNEGLSKLEYYFSDANLEYTITTYTTANGLSSNNIHDVVVFRDTIWIATRYGVSYFVEDNIKTGYAAPYILINQFLVNGKEYDFKKNIELPHAANTIGIHFTGIAYHQQNTVLYRYKLIGVDTGWNYTQSRHIEYPNLAPNTYTFMVAASNGDENWSEDIKRIRFTITPPFWQTYWFVLCCVFGLILLLIVFIQLRIRRIRRKHVLEKKALQFQKEKAEFEKELLELERKALNLQMNPHFIFNALNTIKGFYVENNKVDANRYIDTFAGLMRSILEKTDAHYFTLQDEIEIINSYLELAKIRYDNKFDYTVCIAKDVQAHTISLPALLLQPLIENAVIHGMGGIQRNGMIDVSFKKEANMLVCVIKDNGVGLAKGDKKNKYKLRKPRGIEITKKRLSYISPLSSILLNERIHNGGSSQGTIVTVTIPSYDTKYNC